MKRLKFPLAFLGAVSTLITVYDMYVAPLGLATIQLPLLPFTVSSAALGLLLVFRATSSNNRYTEARKIWGDVVNVTRDLMQQVFNWDKDVDHCTKLISLISLFAASLMCHLRRPGAHNLQVEMVKAVGTTTDVTQDELDRITKRPTGIPAPIFIASRMRLMIKEIGLTEQERLVMEMNVTKLVADVGACERILSTPIPVGYSIHTARFLLIWLSLLPLALETKLGIGTIAGELLLAFGLLGIEDVGIMLEEPFCVLPLEAISNKISREAKALRKVVRDLFEKVAAGNDFSDSLLRPACVREKEVELDVAASPIGH